MAFRCPQTENPGKARMTIFLDRLRVAHCFYLSLVVAMAIAGATKPLGALFYDFGV